MVNYTSQLALPVTFANPKRKIYASITRMNPDGSDLEIYAKGVRNSVGFAWHPGNQGALFYRQRSRLVG